MTITVRTAPEADLPAPQREFTPDDAASGGS
jgi:hypothetical protein